MAKTQDGKYTAVLAVEGTCSKDGVVFSREAVQRLAETATSVILLYGEKVPTVIHVRERADGKLEAFSELEVPKPAPPPAFGTLYPAPYYICKGCGWRGPLTNWERERLNDLCPSCGIYTVAEEGWKRTEPREGG